MGITYKNVVFFHKFSLLDKEKYVENMR